MSEPTLFSIDHLKKLLSGDGVAFTQVFDVISVVGDDSSDFLQGQLSSDVASMEIGETTWSMILTPKGHLLAWHRIKRRADNEYLLVLDEGDGEAALARLSRFKLRVKCDLSLETQQFRAVRYTSDRTSPSETVGFEWNGLKGYDSPLDRAEIGEQTEISLADAELIRILFGIPKGGAELSEGLVAASARIEVASSSFTKGCYVGQELIARMHNRDVAPPTMLHTFELSAGSEPGEVLVSNDGTEAGTLVSVASDVDGRTVGLGYLKRSFSDTKTFAAGPDGVRAEVSD